MSRKQQRRDPIDLRPGRRLTVETESLVAGGAALARAGDGRVVFVTGALPGERVTAVVGDVRRDVAFASVQKVERPSPERRRPDCAHRRAGCGGCGWMHLSDVGQQEAKVGVVCDALRRIARIEPARLDRLVSFAGAVATTGYRTTVRVRGTGDAVGFVADLDAMAATSSAPDGPRGPGLAPRPDVAQRVVAAPTCLVADPALRDLLAHTAAPAGVEITLRTSVATGAATAFVHPPENKRRGRRRSGRGRSGSGRPGTHHAAGGSAAPGSRDPSRSSTPQGRDGDVVRSHPDGAISLPAGVSVGADAVLSESVGFEPIGDVSLRVSAGSFFQSGPQAATLVAAAVAAALPETDDDTTVAADLYAGVGLFSATVLAGASHVVAVESSRAAVADARVNLAGVAADVIPSEVGRWRPTGPFDVVVADPARSGLGRPGVAAVVAANTPVLGLVSCDPASLARDTMLLEAAGFVPESVAVLDLFPQTPHVETVTRFVRQNAPRVRS